MTLYLTEEMIDAIAAALGRSCGECSLCCRLLDVPEAGKPPHDWCPHYRFGCGCSIYATRPSPCRRYTCMWLVNPSLPEHWKPSRCGMILDFHEHEGVKTLRVHVHPDHPERWREEPFYSDLLKVAAHGMSRASYTTVIVIDQRWMHLVLPDRVMPWCPEKKVGGQRDRGPPAP